MGPDHGNYPALVYHTAIILLGIAAGLYLTVWCWSRNPAMQHHKLTTGDHWSTFVWWFGLILLGLLAWFIW